MSRVLLSCREVHLRVSARFGRNRYRFVTVPPELDSNSNNVTIVNAALLSGLYPKLIYVDIANGLQMRTLSNNQAAFFHPSSINFRRKPKDITSNYLVYFTLMYVVAWCYVCKGTHRRLRQSKKLYAWETAPVDDLAILLLCGECDFKVCLFLEGYTLHHTFSDRIIHSPCQIRRLWTERLNIASRLELTLP